MLGEVEADRFGFGGDPEADEEPDQRANKEGTDDGNGHDDEDGLQLLDPERPADDAGQVDRPGAGSPRCWP